MATGESIVDFEEPLVQGNGRERWFLTSKGPVAEPPRRSDRAFRRAPRCHREKAPREDERAGGHRRIDRYCQSKMFNEAIAEEFARARRAESALSLLLIDVDHFKAYNDTYGHLEGDNCLRMIGEVLRSIAKRPCDLAARFGGEEFAILLPGTDRDGALRLAKMLRSALHRRAIPHSESSKAIVTVSIGVANISDRFATPSELVAATDQALYTAKKHGRDRIEAAADQARAA
ncbi:GGDEF domain-containing protein [Rhizobium sp. SU303]|uniref:GGDEF domain-containing protein n=1 Tax=Rhizobium sp. SU303 TaxID=3138065 RepID=UPI001E30D86A|nr:GGDEF domain-containing protein [Rhizobium leguminosarum]UFW79226.1 GGDEF domain-containing protein [Rhizobium leguminosarum bv. viciae]